MAKFPAVKEQMDEIRRGALEIIPEEELVRKLERSESAGTPLIIKQGFDPTRPDLHIGHAVSIRKLRTFQELGHTVVFVVGDYTARVGDPSGRSETRPTLTPAEIEENARTYADQVGRILDAGRVRLEYNSRWLAPLDLADILKLTAAYTVARLLERDDFAKRLAENRPITMMELMYPLMQAYDSVALEADVELGGNDQKFNLLLARTIQERYGLEPQVCLIMPLLRGTDGEQKMSKSYDNYIGIAEPAEEMYGKTMSIPDDVMDEWYQLASGLTGDELAAARKRVAESPYEAKRALAALIVGAYHGAEGAEAGGRHFDQVFRQGGTPEEMDEVTLSAGDPALKYADGAAWAPGLLVAAGLASSNSEAVRLIEQGAVSVDGQTVEGRHAQVPLAAGQAVVLRRGKRHFARVRLEP